MNVAAEPGSQEHLSLSRGVPELHACCPSVIDCNAFEGGKIMVRKAAAIAICTVAFLGCEGDGAEADNAGYDMFRRAPSADRGQGDGNLSVDQGVEFGDRGQPRHDANGMEVNNPDLSFHDASAPVLDAALSDIGVITPSKDALPPELDAIRPQFDAESRVVDADSPVVDADSPMVDAESLVVDAVPPIVDAVPPVVDAVPPVVDAEPPVVDAAPVPRDMGIEMDMMPAQPMMPACADVVMVGVPSTVRGSTARAGDDQGSASCAPLATNGSADFIAYFVAPSAGLYRFDTVDSDFDTVLHVRDAVCGGNEIACNDDAEGTTSATEVELRAEQAVLVIVDGFNREEGQVALSVTARETLCDDMIDNDGDGDFDCEDIDCLFTCENPADWPEAWATFEEQVLAATNVARSRRANCGGQMFPAAPPLTMNIFAQYAARLHSLDMAQENYMDHVSLDGRTFDQRLQQAGYDGDTPWGENIARGQRTAQAVVDAWMTSPGHCSNIMSSDFRVMGVGYAWSDREDDRFKAYWTQTFGASD